jgi:hypothetical protein
MNHQSKEGLQEKPLNHTGFPWFKQQKKNINKKRDIH